MWPTWEHHSGIAMRKGKICANGGRFTAACGLVWATSFLALFLSTPAACNDAAECTPRDSWCRLLRNLGKGNVLELLPSLPGQSDCTGFRCDGSKCLDHDQVCDATHDCADGSDENPAGCLNRTCVSVLDFDDFRPLGLGLVELESVVKSWRCDDGGCISDVYRCDGVPNCRDKSDETPTACFDRSCTSLQFRCSNGQCIRSAGVCNRQRECFDGSDEEASMCITRLRSRPRVTCPARSLNYCADRTQCYQKYEHCDGVVHCYDGSDEDPEMCGYGTTHAPPTVISTRPPAPTPNTPPRPPAPTPPRDTPAPAPTPNTPPPAPVINTSAASTMISSTPQAEDSSASGSPSSEVEFPEQEHEGPARCAPPSCPCPVEGMRHVCVPCHELSDVNDTCAKLQTGTPLCSVRVEQGTNFDVLSCGGQGLLMDFGSFERHNQECVSGDKKVPVLTVVLADCWTAATLALRCHSDGTWGEYGHLTSERQRMLHICQPQHFNSPLCGRKPRYKSTSQVLQLQQSYYARRNLHPWLLGLKKRERYECSATLITNTWLLTAAHCVIRSQESHNMTMDPRNLKVQLSSNSGHDRFVSEVVLHPLYTPGTRPLNDIALVRLERPLWFSDTRYPACVDLLGSGFLSSPFALAFSRANGEKRYTYDMKIQQVDPACHSPVYRCRTLQVQDSQFCGIDLEAGQRLLGGSSGGPFMQNLASDHEESWAVSGVVSYAVEKQECGLPFTIYTAVHIYKEFIENIIYNVT